MKLRNAAAVLATAVLVGGAGGGYAACGTQPSEPIKSVVTSTDTTTPKTPSAGSKPKPTKPSATPSRPSEASPLYYSDNAVHDGDQTVPVEFANDEWPVSSLQRVGDGWLVVQLHSEGGEQQDYRGTVVRPDGTSENLGALGLAWDVDGQDRVLYAPEPGAWKAFDPATGEGSELEIADGSGEEPPAMTNGDPQQWIQWAGGTSVLTGWWSQDGTSHTFVTDLSRGDHSRGAPTGVGQVRTTPGGEQVATGFDESSYQVTGGRLGEDGWWQADDLRLWNFASPYSPNGELLLTVDSRIEGPGPTGFTILDSLTGEVKYELEAPKGTLDVAWFDDRSLLVRGSPNGDPTNPVLYLLDVQNDRFKKIERVAEDVALGGP